MLNVNPTRSEREMYDIAPAELWGEEPRRCSCGAKIEEGERCADCEREEEKRNG